MELLDVQEPFNSLFTQGMILGPDGQKMSKSRGNVIPPTPLIERFGADAVRTYVLNMGPPEQDAAWNDNALAGAHRLLSRIWTLADELAAAGTGLGSVPALTRLPNPLTRRVPRWSWSARLIGRSTVSLRSSSGVSVSTTRLPPSRNWSTTSTATRTPTRQPAASRPRRPPHCCSRSRLTWARRRMSS